MIAERCPIRCSQSPHSRSFRFVSLESKSAVLIGRVLWSLENISSLRDRTRSSVSYRTCVGVEDAAAFKFGFAINPKRHAMVVWPISLTTWLVLVSTTTSALPSSLATTSADGSAGVTEVAQGAAPATQRASVPLVDSNADDWTTRIAWPRVTETRYLHLVREVRKVYFPLIPSCHVTAAAVAAAAAATIILAASPATTAYAIDCPHNRPSIAYRVIYI